MNLSKLSKVGDEVKYGAKVIATVSKVEAFGLNTRITLSNGYSVVVPGLSL